MLRATATLLLLLRSLAAASPALDDPPPAPAPAAAPDPVAAPVEVATRPRPWSGWWWPMIDLPGADVPHLFDPEGPLAKYDRFAQATTGQNPQTRDWEYRNMRVTDVSNSWWGHCNGWAAAAVLEPEPVQPVERSGVRFSVGDQKGVLSAWHQGSGAAFALGAPSRPLRADEFHRAVLDWLVRRSTPLIFNVYAIAESRYQVWNHPAYRVRLVYTPDAADPHLTHVAATLWYADNAVAPDFVGLKPWPTPAGKTYTYVLLGDPDRPAAGDWEGESAGGGEQARPSLVWYPSRAIRVPGLSPPGMRYDIVQAIVGTSPAP